MANTTFDRSIFKKYFNANDPEALVWAENVLDKLVKRGIVAEYIDKYNGDYEELYSSIATFFSYLVRFGREFESFKDNDFLSNEYLKNFGHFTSSNESLDQIQYLISNFLRRRSERGTIDSIKKVNLSTTSPVVPDGEILALLGWDYFTFFKLGVARPQKNSWNVGNSSPCYRGNDGRYDLSLGYEDTPNVKDKRAYPLINENYVFLTTYRGKECLEIEQVPFGQVAGIGLTDLSKEIVIDPRLDYQITFRVAQDVTLENLTFGVKAFNTQGDEINLQNVVTGESDNFFFETRRLNLAGQFYLVRGIIFNKDKELVDETEGRLNIGFGQNLKMNQDVASIIPYIVMDNDVTDDSDSEEDNYNSSSFAEDQGASGFNSQSGFSWDDPFYDGLASVFLTDIKVTPCYTSYSRCFLNNKNFIDVYIVNKSGRYTDVEIGQILREYFISYNTAFKVTQIGEGSSITPEINYLLLEDGSYVLWEDDGKVVLE